MRRALVLAASIGVLSTSAIAHAAPPPIPAAARDDYERARALYKSSDYQGCVEALERAQKAAPDPRFFWNSAACEKKLGHHARAVRYVERYLAAGASALTEEERREANAFLQAASAYISRVSVVANVDGVEVTVDGELMGTTPFARPFVVDEGERTVKYARAGYVTVERREKALAGSELKWTVDLAPARAPETTPPPPDPAPLPTPRPEVTPERGPSRVGPIIVGTLGLAAAAVGGVLVFTTLRDADEIEAECGTTCPPSRWEGSRDRQVIGDALLIGGGALVAGAAVWWILQPSPNKARAAWVRPALGGVSFGGSF